MRREAKSASSEVGSGALTGCSVPKAGGARRDDMSPLVLGGEFWNFSSIYISSTKNKVARGFRISLDEERSILLEEKVQIA